MIRISALNDSLDSDQEEEQEVEVTKEAQETIAVSEYIRALSLKQSGDADLALHLFQELLDTQVLNDVEDKENKLFSVKYNCYRNIGFIYEEKKELQLALKNLFEAVQLDETDVFTQCKVGKLALKLSNLQLAKISFEKCLERNPNHWPAKDGYLETLCQLECINACYGFALKCYTEDKKYERAIRVILEIRDRFRPEYFDGYWSTKFELEADCKVIYDPEKSVFPPGKEIEFWKEKELVIDYDDFRLGDLNWVTFGNLILNLYKYLEDNEYSLISIFKLEDLIGKSNGLETPVVELDKINSPVNTNGNCVNNGVDGVEDAIENGKSPENAMETEVDSENNNTSLLTPETKQKMSSRRRCSDLNFLQQWGWHKNRRTSTRKKGAPELNESIDTTVNGFLRRVLPNYFIDNFESNLSPFTKEIDADQLNRKDPENVNLNKNGIQDEEKFNELSKDSFNAFLNELKDREFDIIIPIFQWLKYVSIYWNQVIPQEICEIFKKIFRLHEDFMDYTGLYHLNDADFKATFRAAMFFFELDFDEHEENKLEITEKFMKNKDYLQFHIGFIEDDEQCILMLLRLHWLNYCIEMFNNRYKDALNYLYKIEEIFDDPKNPVSFVELKNTKNNKTIECKIVKEAIVRIERKINLISVQELYESQNYRELVDILRESIVYSTEPKVNVDTLSMKIQKQIEVLLESLWCLDEIEECFVWAEKSLKYAVNHFLEAPTEYRLQEWAGLVNYCLIYIEASIKEEGSEILIALNKNLPRLIQTLTLLVTHQLDSSTEKNNPQPHLINVNIPWVVLYYLLQKEDDVANTTASKKAKSSSENSTELDELTEETIPNSFMMFFTVHEFLGRKQWCTKENGKLLFFLLDVLTPMYRTPLLEPFRDLISEHIEQTTFCLYGYPVKKARSRHIEDHDAKNIDLSWERAIQLYDLYRPDTLPEFDSYKLASITSEMEQLLQRILQLIPKCLDIQPFTGEIRKFINRTNDTLPKEMSLLPLKVASVYYLLADYYFKNQETPKAIKFYIYDLTLKPERFDSWAGIALCKASKLEMKLNSYGTINVEDFLESADQTINCFNQCLKLKNNITILTEFASFSYNLHSFCSRNLKSSSDTLSMENFSAIEKRKDKFLDISFNCFNQVCDAAESTQEQSSKNQDDDDTNHDEKWYYHFMIGKIAEKKKELPIVYLEHYLKSAKYLYEDNATYPIKINHSNPSNLAIEALEVFYRITSAIIKYLEQHSKINKPTAKLFTKVLKELSTSPFAYNRAKINEDNINALKRKLNTTAEESISKQQKVEPKIDETKTAEDVEVIEKKEDVEGGEKMDISKEISVVPKEEIKSIEEIDKRPETPIIPVIRNIIADSEITSRRGSQESVVTTSTTTVTSTSSSSDTSSDDSSDSESDSTSSDETDAENVFISQEQFENIYKMCIKNLEECVSRFPEHYKSIYRLIYHYLNIKNSLDKCKQLLLGSDYKTTLGNQIQGLFTERKNNNFFNGIWRIPSAEIDRPGNFTSHLSKCVIILMEVLKKINDYDTLMDLALQLQRNPEADKKYLNDMDKKELCHQAVTCCVQTFRNILRDHTTAIGTGKNRDRELLTLMLDIFKSHRKTLKLLPSKDQLQFSAVLVDVYKEYTKDKMVLPENANFQDLASKLCQQEIVYRKNLEKGIVGTNPNPPTAAIQQPQPQPQQQAPAVSSESSFVLNVKSVSDINKSVMSSANNSANSSPSTSNKVSGSGGGSSARTKARVSNKNTQNAQLLAQQNSMNSLLMSMYSDPTLMASMLQSEASAAANANASANALMNEYYKLLGLSGANMGSNMFGGLTPQQLALFTDPSTMNALSMYQAPATPSPSKGSKSANSSYEMKYLESLKNFAASPTSSLAGIQQNLLSNSLSITTTSMTTATTSSFPRATGSTSSLATITKSTNRKSGGLTKEQKQKSAMKTSSATITLGKAGSQVDNSKKYNYMGSNLNLPPDLPKSLTITPAPGKSNNRMPDKIKQTKQKHVLDANAFSVASAKALLGNLKTNPSLSITPEAIAGNLGRFGTQTSYKDFLKNYQAQTASMPIAGGGIGLGKAGQSTSKSASKPQKSRAQQNQQMQQQQMQQRSSLPNPKGSLPKILPSYDLGKNISNFNSLPKSSPTLSSPYMSGRSSSGTPTPTPPLSGSPSFSMISPPKTLQQKLAERKQAGQHQQHQHQKPKKPDNSRNKSMDDDVIVLE